MVVARSNSNRNNVRLLILHFAYYVDCVFGFVSACVCVSLFLHCALSLAAPQCIVIGPVCVFAMGGWALILFVGLLQR